MTNSSNKSHPRQETEIFTVCIILQTPCCLLCRFGGAQPNMAVNKACRCRGCGPSGSGEREELLWPGHANEISHGPTVEEIELPRLLPEWRNASLML